MSDRLVARLLRLSAAISLISAVGCAPALSARNARGNASANADVRLRARLLQMADVRRANAPLLDSALNAATPWVRRAAVLTVGQLHERSLAPRLRVLMADADSSIAATAAFALGLMADTGSVASLASAVRSAPLTVAAEAAWSLGEIGGPAREAIDAALATPPSDRAFVTEALLLTTVRVQPFPVERVRALLGSSDVRVARAAAYAASRVRAPGTLRAISALATSSDAETRSYAARALARRPAGDSLGELAGTTLARLVVDADPHVRINAVRSLATFGASARNAILAVTHDRDANVRVASVESLELVLDSLDAGAWRDAWAADTGFMFRRTLLQSALRSGPRAASDMLAWSTGDWRRDVAIVEALGPRVDEVRARYPAAGLPSFDAAWSSPDARLRAAAYGAAASADSGAAAAAWRARLLSALDDADGVARSNAIGALRASARADEVRRVLDAYARGQKDADNDARLAALGYLSAAWRRDSAGWSASDVAATRALPAPSASLERAAARGASPFASWSAVTDSAKPIEWYEDRVRRWAMPSSPLPLVRIVTDRGTVTLALYGMDAPLTVDNYVSLAKRGFYRDVRFHRVVPNFVAQDGDPRGDGSGGPAYAIRDELNRRRYERGAVGMALSGPDTGGSQYFLTLSPQPHLDGHYTVFARVVDGWDVMDRLVQGDRIREVRIQ